MEFLRKKLGLILRVFFSGLLIYFLFRNKNNLIECVGYIQKAKVTWLLLGLLSLGVTMFLSTYRWQILLHVQEINMTFARLFPMNMIGQFFSSFLLGVTGGDVIKIYYVSQANPDRRSAAGLSVIYDRILGLLGIMIWGLFFTSTRYAALVSSPNTHKAVWIFLLICAAAVGGILFASILPWIRKNSGLWKLEQKLPFHQTIENLSEALQRYTRRPWENLFSLTLSVLIHGFLFLFMFCVARSIHLELSFWQLASVVSIVNVVIAIPISFGGIGFRENLFVWFLALFGVSSPQALAFSLMGFGLNLIWSMVGGYIYLNYKKHAAEGHPVASS